MKLCEHCRKLIQKRVDYLEYLDRKNVLRGNVLRGEDRDVAIQQLKHLLDTEIDTDYDFLMKEE